MKELLLLRHAKSSWDDRLARDFDRPLNARGRAAAPMMGDYLAARGRAPDLVLCSSAARARETFALVAGRLRPTPPAIYKDGLYLASPERMLEIIRAAPAGDDRLLVVAHNPGLEELAFILADPARGDASSLKRLRLKYPTAGLAHFACDWSDWREISPGAGALKAFVTPRDLAPGAAAG